MSEKKIRSIEDLGEFGLIEHLTDGLETKQESTHLGVGDDAAVIDHGTYYQVLTTDLLLEGVHFDLVYTPLKHLGYKAVVLNLADVYAMNAAPRQLTAMACEKYNVDLVGGDTSGSMTGLVLSISVLGTAKKEELTTRSGAAPNQLICVSGDLGGAYMGLRVLEREKQLHAEDPEFQPGLEGYDYVVERYLKPEPALEVLLALREADIVPTSMIDISDGLSSELLHLCNASGLGCQIYDDRIPIAEETSAVATEFQMEPLVAALHGGEDFEMLFTVPLSAFDKVSALDGVSVIGNMTEEGGQALLVGKDGTGIPLQAQGRGEAY